MQCNVDLCQLDIARCPVPQAWTRRRRDSLSDYFDTLPDPAAICDLKGEILHVNRAWCAFGQENGYGGAGFIGQNYLNHCKVEDGVEAVDASKVRDGLRALAKGDLSLFTHVYPAHGPRERRWYRLLANRVGDELVIHHRSLVCEHSDLAQEARALPKYLNAERDAQIAHDIKTALNGMLGYVQLSRSLLSEEQESGRAGEYLENAEQAGWRISNFLDGMLHRAQLRRPDNAAPETAGLAAHEEQIDLRQTVNGAFSMLFPTAPDIAFDLVDRLDAGVRLLGDLQAVERILMNLISNSTKYGKEYGRVMVHLDRDESGGIRIMVADDGIGIPGRLLPHIFDRFQRDPAHADRINGTGLGLANVKDLVDEMDGVIMITSEVDKGTIVTIQFPAWRTVAVDTPPTASGA